jgi:hypothetical protein
MKTLALTPKKRGERRTKHYRWGRNPSTTQAVRGSRAGATAGMTAAMTALMTLNSGWRRVEYTGWARAYNPVEFLKFHTARPGRNPL